MSASLAAEVLTTQHAYCCGSAVAFIEWFAVKCFDAGSWTNKEVWLSSMFEEMSGNVLCVEPLRVSRDAC